MPTRRELEEARQREARQALDDLRRGAPTWTGSSLSHAARHAADHFSGKDAIGTAEGSGTDPVELWGRRIGRALSLIGCIGLAIYLVATYVLR